MNLLRYFFHSCTENYHCNPYDLDMFKKHCCATCKVCGKTKWVDFYTYSMYTGMVTMNDHTGVTTRDMIKTLQDPWGKVLAKETLEEFDKCFLKN